MSKTIEQTYTKKTQLEHILLRPDTYIGSVERYSQPMWVLDDGKLVNRNTNYVPGLYKIFDEILVNAADNKQRDSSMNKLQVEINPEANTISVWNNGKGIPVVLHSEHNCYVPELIFGHLLTGSNFDDGEDKTTGGRNGFGAKLANIFSTEFIVETADSERGLQYKQIFRNNMSVTEKPVITKLKGNSDYTCITFKPDLARFKMNHLEADIVALMGKRVYDMAGSNKMGQLAVYLNRERIAIKNFKEYIEFYKSSESSGFEELIVFETCNSRWEVGVGISDGSFHQVSFVNSICSSKGGTHVQYIVDQITNRLAATVKKKNKGVEVKPANIRNHLFVYVNALITNPTFDSQTKEALTTRPNVFSGSKSTTPACTLSDKTLKAIESSSALMDHILRWAKTKQDQELKKKGGSKFTKVLGIPKLDDANNAGTSRSKDCTLILTEGDSAKALAISGLGVIGRDNYGVFPLKGKLLNVREATHQQIMKNEEIQNIAKILGLTFGRVYTDCSTLRYGHLLIMTDQDHDGSHIKGLIINFIHHFWPSLLKVEGFLQQFITPIVKCTKGRNDEEVFFTIPEYAAWKEAHADGKGWKIKYYKGLGTSTSAEAKEYFSNLPKHLLKFTWQGIDGQTSEEDSNHVIELAFNKKYADQRKQWLLDMEPDCHIDYNVSSIDYPTFVNKELVLFSHADNARSIPHVMDGFKPSQRKVLFSCLKRNLKNEIKVAQLAGYVSEHSAYHHGEMSLTQTIIGMAQSFVGSNNVNLLSPCGQFGTRLMGGKDAASPRYVFTKLEPITRAIFHPDDDQLLNYLDEDGDTIEPDYYVPVIPMLLVNGSEGIGTGWSTSVPTYNPREIIANLRNMIMGEPQEEMIPWFRGFTGEVKQKTGKDHKNFTVSGIVEITDDQTLTISELPVGKWTYDYKQMLESMIIGNSAAVESTGPGSSPVCAIVKDFKENHTDTTVLFTVHVPSEKLEDACNEPGGIHKKFKLDGSVATTNMHAFDPQGKIVKYDSVREIMNCFFDVRLETYEKRKAYLLSKLTNEFEKLDNKVRFILAVINGTLIVSNRKKNDIFADLQKQGFKMVVPEKNNKKSSEEGGDSQEEEAEDASTSPTASGYDYLLSMKLWSLTMEKVQSLTADRNGKQAELDALRNKSVEDLWMNDLDALEAALDEFDRAIEMEREEELSAMRKAQKNVKGGSSRATAVVRAPKVPVSTNLTGLSTKGPVAVARAPVDSAAAAAKRAAAKAAAASESAAEKAASAPEPAAQVAKQAVVSDVPMSLAQRLLARMQLEDGGAPTAQAAVAPTFSFSSSSAAPKVGKAAPKVTKAAAPKKTASKKTSKYDSDSEEELSDADCFSDSEVDYDVSEPIERTAPPARTARAAAPKKFTSYVDDSEEEEQLSESEEDEMSLDEESEEEDFEFEAKPKSKPKAAAAAPAPKKVAAPAPVKKAAIIKATKSYSDDDEEEESTFSDDNAAPAPAPVVKAVAPKPAKAKAAAPAPVRKPLAAVSTNVPAPKKAPAAKKASKKIADDSEDEDFFDDNAEMSVKPVATVTAPVRAGRAAAKKSYAAYAEDSEDDEDAFRSESEDDFGSDDEDDYGSSRAKKPTAKKTTTAKAPAGPASKKRAPKKATASKEEFGFSPGPMSPEMVKKARSTKGKALKSIVQDLTGDSDEDYY